MKFDDILNLIIERIQITETDFGTKKPFKDYHFNRQDDYIFTFFEHEDQVVVVSYDDNKSLNFGILKDGEVVMSHSESSFHFKRIQEFYGKILYIFSRMVQEFNIKTFIVYASPFEPKLKKIYDNFAKNSNIQSLLKGMGFSNYRLTDVEEYDGTTFKVHQFSKDYLKK